MARLIRWSWVGLIAGLCVAAFGLSHVAGQQPTAPFSPAYWSTQPVPATVAAPPAMAPALPNPAAAYSAPYTNPTPSYTAPGYPPASYPAPSYPAPYNSAAANPTPGYPPPGYAAPTYPAPTYPAPTSTAPIYDEYAVPALPPAAPNPYVAQAPPPPPPPLPAPPPPPAAPEPSPEVVPTPDPALPADETITIPAADATTVVIEPLPKLWSGSVDVGLNGSEGNTQLFNFRMNTQAKRATPFSELTLKSNYVKTATNSNETANRLFFDGRWERLSQTSPWTFYVHGTTEYDEFQLWDVRISGDTGLGYRFLKNDFTTLTGRVGPGASREFGGPNDSWVPELVFNLQAEHAIGKRHKLTLQVDYFPDPSQWSTYRLNSQASWAIVLDEVRNLSLKLSAIDRYSSNSGTAKPNDLDYAATLLWSF